MLLAVADAAPCSLDAPLDAPFEVAAPRDAKQVRVLIEIWAPPQQQEWTHAMLAELDARGLVGTVVVSSATPTALTASLVDQPHELALRLHNPPVDPTSGPRRLRAELRPLRKQVGGVKTVIAPLQSHTTEAILGRAGFRVILPEAPQATATPRPASVFDGQPRIGVVLPAGPYAGACGTRPVGRPLTPRTLDRATQAIHGAARSGHFGVVRVILSEPAAGTPALLGRWLDQVLLPSGARVLPPSQLRPEALHFLHTASPKDVDPATSIGGRLVPREAALAAAEGLRDVRTLPRELAGELVPTEAFLAFAKLLANQTEGEVIRIGALDGPSTSATTTLSGPLTVPRDAVAASASALLAALPKEVPAALPVRGRLLTASELLLLYASAVRGDDPVQTRPVAVAEPNQRGLGWGSSSVP